MAVTLQYQNSYATPFGQASVSFGSTSADDLLLVMIARDALNPETSGYNYRMVSDGFSELFYYALNPPDTSIQLLYKISDGTSDTAIINYDTNSQSTDTIIFTARFSGVETSNPFNVVGSPDDSSSGPPLTVNSITTTVNDCYGICFFGYDGGDGDPFSVSGSDWVSTPYYQESGDGGGDVGGGWSYKSSLFSAGPSGDAFLTNTGIGGADGVIGIQFAIQPSGTGGGFSLGVSGVSPSSISKFNGVLTANINSISGA